MTDKAAEQLRACREAFESWLSTTSGWKACKQRGKPMSLRQASDGNYIDFRVNDRWFAYKAAWNTRADSGEAVALNVEVRRCDVCDHIGISDASKTQGACHECDWQGDEPVEDKCPGCGHTDCMAAACPECGGRYELIADRQFTHPSATSGDVRDAERWQAFKRYVSETIGGNHLLDRLAVLDIGAWDQCIDELKTAIASREGR